MFEIYFVDVGAPELACVLAGDLISHLEVVVDHNNTAVKSNMVVGAQAKDIRGDVWPVVRLSEWPDVRTLGICPGGGLDSEAADLALVVVEFLDRLDHRSVSDSSLNA